MNEYLKTTATKQEKTEEQNSPESIPEISDMEGVKIFKDLQKKHGVFKLSVFEKKLDIYNGQISKWLTGRQPLSKENLKALDKYVLRILSSDQDEI